jgi:hypothetical protein
MPNGFFVPSHMITLKEAKKSDDLVIYKGQVLEIKAEFDLPDDYDVYADEQQGPVIKGLFKYTDAQPGGLQDLVDNEELDTELQPWYIEY